jgi:hypothetical protein
MEINLKSEMSLKEAEEFILSVGNEVSTHLVGQPGVGKTAMYERIVEKTGFRGIYIDTPNTELGDIGIPMPNHENKTTALYPNENWGFHYGDPCVIFIDEFTKPSSPAVQNMLHPLLSERRLGGFKLHEDSIVITAGNNTTDGVGDMLKDHSINRLTICPICQPNGRRMARVGGSQWCSTRGDGMGQSLSALHGIVQRSCSSRQPVQLQPEEPETVILFPALGLSFEQHHQEAFAHHTQCVGDRAVRDHR